MLKIERLASQAALGSRGKGNETRTPVGTSPPQAAAATAESQHQAPVDFAVMKKAAFTTLPAGEMLT